MLITILAAATGVNRTQAFNASSESARSTRLPRRVPHCSRHFPSKQAMSSERGSAWRASTCHRARSFVANELTSGTLRTTLRYGCISERRVASWKPGSPCTIWLRRQESASDLMGKAKNHRATCAMVVQLLPRLQ